MSSDQPAAIGALKTARLHDGVVDVLLAQIVRGEAEQATLLASEPELCDELGVSRTVVRQAIGILASKGVVTVEHGRGTRVNPPELWAPLDPLILRARLRAGQRRQVVAELADVRRMFEIEIAGLAAERSEVRQLDTIADAFRDLEASGGDHRRYEEADVRFHRGIAAATNNSMLSALQRPIAEALGEGLIVDIEATFAGAVAHHRALLDALYERDRNGARHAMRVIVDNWERIHNLSREE